MRGILISFLHPASFILFFHFFKEGKKLNAFLRLVFVLTFVAAVSYSSNAMNFDVNTTADTQDASPGNGWCRDASNNCSLRAAITEANALAGNDTIYLSAGVYTQSRKFWGEDDNEGGDWDIRSNLTIIGAAHGSTILQAHASANSGFDRVLHSVFTTNVVNLSYLTIRHGYRTGGITPSTKGGGIRNAGTMNLYAVAVASNVAPIGGGIYNEGNLTINSSVVTSNTCQQTAGGCHGGGMHNDLYPGKTLSVNSSRFTQNQVVAPNGGFGAGISVLGHDNFTVSIIDSVLNENRGSSGITGGGLYVFAGNGNVAVNLTNSEFSLNRPISSNPAHMIKGGGIAVSTNYIGNVSGTWSGLDISENNSPLNGSCNADGVPMIFGGGIFVESEATATIALNNSRIYRNHSSEGAGIKTKGFGTGSFSMTNVEVAENCSRLNDRGGAVHATGAISFAMDFSTVTENRGYYIGGIFSNTTGTFEMKNSIVSENYAAFGGGPNRDLQGSFVSQNYNHFGLIPGSGVFITGVTTNNTTGSSLLVWSSAENAYVPGTGSPALNAIPAGTNGCGSAVATDINSNPRPLGGACEKGAVEVQ